MRIRNSVLIGWSLISVGIPGCGLFNQGPTSIVTERPNYNEVVRQTSRDQVFDNIVRVYNHDIPQFIDVTNITAQLSFSGSLNGSASLPPMAAGGGSLAVTEGGTASGSTVSTKTLSFHPGHDYTLGLTAALSEMPTITYQPLQGQALVSQIATPLTVDTLVNLYDSDWPVSSLLEMAADRITPRHTDYETALNAIIDLDAIKAIALTAESSTSAGASAQTSSASRNDLLAIYIQPQRPPTMQSGDRNSPNAAEETQFDEITEDNEAGPLWRQLQETQDPVPRNDVKRIALRTAAGTYGNGSSTNSPVTPSAEQPEGVDFAIGGGLHISVRPAKPPPAAAVLPTIPALRTRSAIGVLKSFAPGSANAEFLSPDEYEKFIAPEIPYTDAYYRFDPKALEDYRNYKEWTKRAHKGAQIQKLINERSNYIAYAIAACDIYSKAGDLPKAALYRTLVKHPNLWLYKSKMYLYTNSWPLDTQLQYFRKLEQPTHGETGRGQEFAFTHLSPLALSLRDAGYDVSFAWTLADACDLIKTEHPALILLNDHNFSQENPESLLDLDSCACQAGAKLIHNEDVSVSKLSSSELSDPFVKSEIVGKYPVLAKKVLVVDSIESAVGKSTSPAYRLGQARAAEFRHYLIVVYSDDPTNRRKCLRGEHYSCYNYAGDDKWYWIEEKDMVSRRNFALVAQFLTMQAVAPTQNAGPTPTLSVGGPR